jgi:alpha-beta hydrolase superfamily lysophospholipase
MMDGTKIHEKQRLIRFKADDGFPISALLVTKDHGRKEDITDIPLLLQVHGLLGHFLARGTPRLLPHALLECGFNSLSINTRLANAGQITGVGIFDDTIRDIDAAVTFLLQEGFKTIFVLGYSLGASMVAHWATNREYPQVKGLILESVLYSGADSQRKRFEKWGSTPTYEEIIQKARSVLGNDPYNSVRDESFVVYQAKGPSREPINNEIFTYKTWWFMAGPEGHRAMACKQIGNVRLPILIMRGENDPLVEEWEPEELGKIARRAGNRRVKVKQIPKARHDCMENPEMMLKEIVAMMSAGTV